MGFISIVERKKFEKFMNCEMDKMIVKILTKKSSSRTIMMMICFTFQMSNESIHSLLLLFIPFLKLYYLYKFILGHYYDYSTLVTHC